MGGGAVSGGWKCGWGPVLGYGNAFAVESGQWGGGEGGTPPPLQAMPWGPPPPSRRSPSRGLPPPAPRRHRSGAMGQGLRPGTAGRPSHRGPTPRSLVVRGAPTGTMPSGRAPGRPDRHIYGAVGAPPPPPHKGLPRPPPPPDQRETTRVTKGEVLSGHFGHTHFWVPDPPPPARTSAGLGGGSGTGKGKPPPPPPVSSSDRPALAPHVVLPLCPPPPPEGSIRAAVPPQEEGGGVPPPPDPPPPQTKGTIVGNNEIYKRGSLVGPFWVRTLLGPRPPPQTSPLKHNTRSVFKLQRLKVEFRPEAYGR